MPPWLKRGLMPSPDQKMELPWGTEPRPVEPMGLVGSGAEGRAVQRGRRSSVPCTAHQAVGLCGGPEAHLFAVDDQAQPRPPVERVF